MCSSPWVHPRHGPTKCGQCMECRLAYSREWAIRMTHEQSCHQRSCFLTLTYSPEHLPRFGQLVKADLRRFFNRMWKTGLRFRYVACGEYGERNRRPHFHVALYGLNFFEDRIFYMNGSNGDPLFISATLSKFWPEGISTIGSLTFESSAYIARYITMRLNESDKLSIRPLAVDPDTGEMVMPNPEFLVMSRNPGIGAKWFDEWFHVDVLPHGRVIANGNPAPIPRFYKEKLRRQNLMASMFLENKVRHQMPVKPFELSEDRPERRSARTRYANSRSGIFKRDVE